MNYKIVECSGYTPEEAFASLDFNPLCPYITGRNVTISWKKALKQKENKPIVGTTDFKNFVESMLAKRTHNTPGLGIYINISPSTPSSRSKPVKVYNVKTKTKKSWHLVYQIREDKYEINELQDYTLNDLGQIEVTDKPSIKDITVTPGPVLHETLSKAEAIKIAQKLVVQTHKNYSVVPVKISDNQRIAAYCAYTPSSNASKGTWIAIGIPKTNPNGIINISTGSKSME